MGSDPVQARQSERNAAFLVAVRVGDARRAAVLAFAEITADASPAERDRWKLRRRLWRVSNNRIEARRRAYNRGQASRLRGGPGAACGFVVLVASLALDVRRHRRLDRRMSANKARAAALRSGGPAQGGTMTKARDLEYIAVRLDAVHRLARNPEVRARVAAAKARLCRGNGARPLRADIADELNAVAALAKASGDLRGRAAAVTMKRWAAGAISEAECSVLLGLADDAPRYPTPEDDE